MKNLLHIITKQRNIGKQWGIIAQVAGQISIFVSIIILCLSMVTAYNTTLSGWLVDRGIYISFWVFAAVIAFLVIIPAILVWKFALPSYLSSLNEQIYKHDNPIRRDIEKVAEDTAEIKRLLKEMINKK